MLIKEKIQCCLLKYTKDLTLNNKYLIKDVDLENKTKLLFLYLFVIEDNCDLSNYPNILNRLNKLCECNECVDCKTQTIVVENWITDISNYDIVWLGVDTCCEQNKIIWKDLISCCEQRITWKPLIVCCEQAQIIWKPVKLCCEQNIIWKPLTVCCEQKTKIKKCKKCKTNKLICKCKKR